MTTTAEAAVQQASGLLLVDKPAGLTSHDVVARVRRAFRTKRVGHAGTLDPFATGLLVCAVGQATRLLPYVHGEPKVYRTRIVFGVGTDTDDLTGKPVASGAAPAWDALPSALEALTGALQQLPPAYSAKHVDGERAYAKARRGEAVTLAPVSITVFGWEILARGEDWLEADISCSGGTYIRSLARDLGRALGTVAHCAVLRRLQSGDLRVEESVPVEALRPGEPLPLRSPLPALRGLAVQPIDAPGLAALRTGRQVPASVPGERAALVAPDGAVVAVAERVSVSGGDRWQPRVVLLGPGDAS